MSRFVEKLNFDTNLFKFNVGRIDLHDKDLELLNKFPSLDDILRQAYSSGFKVIYIFAPTNEIALTKNQSISFSYPGILVDVKTTYKASLSSFQNTSLVDKAFIGKVRIRKYDIQILNANMRKLGINSGGYSRFKVDEKIPFDGYEAMFEAWTKNSINRSAADEVFVAYSNDDPTEEIGFITVKKTSDTNVNIGLLSVSANHRRLGIATSLLSRAVLWAFEEIGHEINATINVITQGSNQTACQCYEKFGFIKYSTQQVYHVWLPDHLLENVSVSDQSSTIPFCKQHLTGKENHYVNQVFSSGLDSASHFTLMCSAKLQDILGPESERVVMVPSGTAALEMAALLCNFEVGDEVIMPSYTFSSTANAFVLRGAIPVFIDITEDHLNMNVNLIEPAITKRTKAICVVHYGGVPCDMDFICEMAKKHNLIVIEDAAQGFLSTYKGRQVGTIGDYGCFSFHYTKNIMCGEGGALSVNRSVVNAKRALVIWEKGTNRYDFVTGKIDKYHWIDIGSSFVPSEVSCAILWAQLENCQSITSSRMHHYLLYHNALSPFASKGLFKIPSLLSNDENQNNAHIFFLIFPNENIRKLFETKMKANGISAFSHYVPLHNSPAGLKYGIVGVGEENNMTVTDHVHKCMLRLPIWADMTNDHVNHIISVIIETAMSLNST
eukprot:gene9288-12515_t